MPTTHEQRDLGEDMKRNGQKLPIIVANGYIIDGRNRFLACQKVGIKPRIVEVNVRDPKSLIMSLNYFRRHYSTQERVTIAALMSLSGEDVYTGKIEKAQNCALTEEQAAKTMNVSRRSVQYAKKKLRQKSQLPAETAIVDDMGYPVPGTARAYWNRKGEAEAVLSKLRHAKRAIGELLPDDPMWCEVNLNGVIADLSSAISRFTGAIPSYVCPQCDGREPDNCEVCKGRGVISRFMWKMIPKELTEKRKLIGAPTDATPPF